MNKRIYLLQLFNFYNIKNRELQMQRKNNDKHQKLNKIFKLNLYSMFFQLNIIVAVMSALYIFIINCVKFFYQ